ncbi:glycosyltransferase family 2 protein [Frigoribacterium sp. NBH87]|uniref:glycosyltransferase family 2 protein n=1 Tax=Frigoribacterium sp. NBH87 TaxID=2596916 RepID=UPI0016237A78|nr:glycosyltransferase [Frigoribacterium sp. NBH87]
MTDHRPPTGPVPPGHDRHRIGLPTSDSPVASVVVLAWRLGEPLVACLEALAAQRDAPPFEVVLVLNGASGEARAAAARVDGAVVVDLPENAGFGGGCAAGATAARGRALVLLNDDAVVAPTWLAALHARARADDRPVAVGSLLLGADGRVQEAGCRILPDAGTVPRGRGLTEDEARAADLLRSRPVDYCSAAALWVDRETFDRVGGFDELFAPAYYEDVDLQLRLRATGRPVVVEPAAVAAHLSGASTDSVPLYREFLGHRNGTLFARRWADTLAAVPAERTDGDDPLEVLPPDLGAAPATDGDDAHPAVAADYVRWLAAEVARLRSEAVGAAVQLGELDEIRTELSRLQAEHHETAQASHAMLQHIEHLEAQGPLEALRSRWHAQHDR